MIPEKYFVMRNYSLEFHNDLEEAKKEAMSRSLKEKEKFLVMKIIAICTPKIEIEWEE